MGRIRGIHSSPGTYTHFDDISYGSSAYGQHIIKTDEGSDLTVIIPDTWKTKGIKVNVYTYIDGVITTIPIKPKVLTRINYVSEKNVTSSFILVQSNYMISKIYSIADEKDEENTVLVFDDENPDLKTTIFEEKEQQEINGHTYNAYGLIYDTILKSETNYKIIINKI